MTVTDVKGKILKTYLLGVPVWAVLLKYLPLNLLIKVASSEMIYKMYTIDDINQKNTALNTPYKY